MPKPKVIVVISGGISAYKIPETIRQLVQKDIEVVVVVTQGATQFVTHQTLQTVSENPVYDAIFDSDPHIRHLSLLQGVAALIVAPATANFLAKCANGLADDLASALFLSFEGPKLVVPAMHTQMWKAAPTQRNIRALQKDGIHILGPVAGRLACNDTGLGRMVEPHLIANAVEFALHPVPNVVGKRVVITAGGTQEPIDDVRVITNLSSGKWGHCLASFLAFWGAEVYLITTKPLAAEDPNIAAITQVQSANELQNTLESAVKKADALYMMAAVSDFTVKKSSTKLKRGTTKTLDLMPTPDILATLKKPKNCRIIGFCLESEKNLLKSAAEKRVKKDADYIIANTPENLGQDTRTFWVVPKQNKPTQHKNLSLVAASACLAKLI